MSNERTSLEPALSSSDSDAAPAPHVGETAAVLEAVARMQSALGDRAATSLEGLRGELGAMAGVIAKAQAVIEPYEQVGALLRDLERRVGAMLTLVAPQPEPEAATAEVAEALSASADDLDAERVPTVSDVVSQLGRADEGDGTAPPAEAGAPTVSMLQAMVEALTAPAEPVADVTQVPSSESAVDQHAADAQTTAEPDADERAAVAELGAAAVAEPVPEFAEAEPHEPPSSEPHEPPAPAAQEPIMPEVDLLWSFARMETVPFLPPEIGTAVIFEREARQEQSEPAAVDSAGVSGDAPQPDEAQSASDEEPAAFLFEPMRPASLRTPPAPDTDDAEPAAFLLEPAPPAPRPGPAHDPLAPLKLMSAEEKIALFS